MSQSSVVSRNTLNTLLIVAIFVGYLLVSVNIMEISEEKLKFIFLNIVLFVYLMWEIWRIARTVQWRVLIQPVVLASLFHFLGTYLIPNLRYMYESTFPNLPYGLLFSRTDAFDYLNSAMWAILLAVFAMWRGYRSIIAVRFATSARAFLINKGLIRSEFRVNFVPIIILVVISVCAVFLQIKLGVFGYSSDSKSLKSAVNIFAWFKLANDGGVLVLLILSMAIFTERYKNKPGIWLFFLIILSLQIIIGFLSGFKSQVIMPIVIIGVSYYVVRGRIPYKWISIAIVMVMVSYQVIEPFRYMFYSSANFDNRSLTSITSALVDAVDRRRNNPNYSTLERVIARQDLTTFTAQSIAFKEKYGVPDGSPDFLDNILLSPAHAFVPRFIWENKSIENTGYWYNVNVLGASVDTRTSVAMGPVSYANFAGGYIAIFLVFWFIGFIQRVTFDTFVRAGIGGWMIYLGLLFPLVMIPSSVGGMLAGFFRSIPFIIIAQYWLLKSKK